MTRMPRIPVLAYHKIDVGFELGVNCIAPRTFERQMRFLAEQGYTAITVDQLVDACSDAGDRNRDTRERDYDSAAVKLPLQPILITFDDGYENFYTHAYPILKAHHLTATVFVLAGYIGELNTWDVRLRLKRSRHLNREQIQTLFGDGIGVASHGMYHRFLTHCHPAKAKRELEDSKSVLEEILNHPIHSFAYPYGSVNAKVVELVKSAGYHIAFGLNPSQELKPSSMYCFPRIAIYRHDTDSSFQAKLGRLGEYRFGFECLKNRVINRFAYLNQLRG